MKKIVIILGVLLILIILAAFLFKPKSENPQLLANPKFWTFTSVDTMKYSRDLARQMLTNLSFDTTIELQVKSIADTGASHVAIATPYDEEFIPFLTRWLAVARKYNLKVWFRGNFSGWEGWFGYKPISRAEHLAKMKDFIDKHSGLFENGDVFSPCPECENGGPGDPRQTGDVVGHQQFLVDEYKTSLEGFRLKGKSVATNYHPMNADVARLVMDKATTKALGGLVVIDHYVADPGQLATDVAAIAKQSGGRVVLGEFGVPIPDINGTMTETDQAGWLREALIKLSGTSELTGVNYWTSYGGSTEIWTSDGTAKLGAKVVTAFYKPMAVKGQVIDETGDHIPGVLVKINNRTTVTDKEGRFAVPGLAEKQKGEVTATSYKTYNFSVTPDNQNYKIVLVKDREDLFFLIRKFFAKLF